MKRHIVYISALILIICTAVFPQAVRADNPGIMPQYTVLWEKGRISLTCTVALDRDSMPFPRAREQAEKNIDEFAPRNFWNAVSGLPYNSTGSLLEYVESIAQENERRMIMESISVISGKGVKLSSVVTADLRTLQVTYEYPFYGASGLAVPFIRHTDMAPPGSDLGYQSTRRYSGIVIYAKGELPAWGKNGTAKVMPAMFPKIWALVPNPTGDTIENVYSVEKTAPDSVRKWGMCQYFVKADESAQLERAGRFPLQIMAFGVYGKNNTDPIISREAADQILKNPDNLLLLSSGRVVIIVDETSQSL
ncbi:MAG: hypothetical protein EHM28_07095 [Spirochaetaceae bacterium]|nr:MAG: hypothetical protein EHM28_07095 [Spirochaetaceae bacterium]